MLHVLPTVTVHITDMHHSSEARLRSSSIPDLEVNIMHSSVLILSDHLWSVVLSSSS